MTTHRVVNILSVCMLFGTLLFSGCVNYLQPELGAIARPEARIELAKNGVQDAVWTTKDLDLTYSYSESGNTFSLLGSLVFDRSLTDSFGLVEKFSLKMNFLDGEGRVLETVDITPLFRFLVNGSEEKLKIKSSCSKPVGTSSIAFNYFGVFKSSAASMEIGGASWEIFYFPFD